MEMENELEQFLEVSSKLESEQDWESLVYTFIDQSCELGPQQTKSLSPEAFQSELQNKTKVVISLFIKKYIKKLREYQKLTDLQDDSIAKLKLEIGSLKEENEQLNEMSLTLITQIKRLKKYTNESDILVSILRGEIYKLRHQNKMLVNALKQLYEGNEELATKMLTNTFSDDQESFDSPQERTFTSPGSSGKRQKSLMDDKLLSRVPKDVEFRMSASLRGRKRHSTADIEKLSMSERLYIPTEGADYENRDIIVDEEDEYTQDLNVDEFKGEINEDEIDNFGEKGSETSEKIENVSIILAASPESRKSLRQERIDYLERFEVPLIRNLLSIGKLTREGSPVKDKELTVSELFSGNFAANDGIGVINFPKIKVDRLSKWLKPSKSKSLKCSV